MIDLRPYAERLAKAMPERFYLREYSISDPVNDRAITFDKGCSIPHQWAFFGPLLDEFEVTFYGMARAGDPYDIGGLVRYGESWLEAVAEAVCQAAEAKAREIER